MYVRTKCRGCGGPPDRGPRKLCEACLAKPERVKRRHGNTLGLVTVRRLYALRLRASARLPLFTRGERNAI